jgi:hypothetical protein
LSTTDPVARREYILSLSAVALGELISYVLLFFFFFFFFFFWILIVLAIDFMLFCTDSSRRLTSVEVVSTFLEQAKFVNQELNAVTCWNEHALEEAAAMDAHLATQPPLGPFHGVPITVKDHIAVEGLLQTFCLAAFATHVAVADAPVVQRLKAAGAIVIAKTTMPPLGLAFDTSGMFRPLFPPLFHQKITVFY